MRRLLDSLGNENIVLQKRAAAIFCALDWSRMRGTLRENNETKWFVNRLNNGQPSLLFQTSWLDGVIQREKVWNKSDSRWQASRIIHDNFLKPDVNIDEVTQKYAHEQFPEAMKEFRFL
jgi:ABC-type uncharacterized transport system permease subunit